MLARLQAACMKEETQPLVEYFLNQCRELKRKPATAAVYGLFFVLLLQEHNLMKLLLLILFSAFKGTALSLLAVKKGN